MQEVDRTCAALQMQERDQEWKLVGEDMEAGYDHQLSEASKST